MLNTNKKRIFCVSISKDPNNCPANNVAYLLCSISKNSKFEGIDFGENIFIIKDLKNFCLYEMDNNIFYNHYYK